MSKRMDVVDNLQCARLPQQCYMIHKVSGEGSGDNRAAKARRFQWVLSAPGGNQASPDKAHVAKSIPKPEFTERISDPNPLRRRSLTKLATWCA